jgi:hypothetical protein
MVIFKKWFSVQSIGSSIKSAIKLSLKTSKQRFVLLAVLFSGLALTACMKFNPDVASLMPLTYSSNGLFSNLSSWESTSPRGFQLKGSLERMSASSQVSLSGNYRLNSSPIAIKNATNSITGGSF